MLRQFIIKKIYSYLIYLFICRSLKIADQRRVLEVGCVLWSIRESSSWLSYDFSWLPFPEQNCPKNNQSKMLSNFYHYTHQFPRGGFGKFLYWLVLILDGMRCNIVSTYIWWKYFLILSFFIFVIIILFYLPHPISVLCATILFLKLKSIWTVDRIFITNIGEQFTLENAMDLSKHNIHILILNKIFIGYFICLRFKYCPFSVFPFLCLLFHPLFFYEGPPHTPTPILPL